MKELLEQQAKELQRLKDLIKQLEAHTEGLRQTLRERQASR